MRVLIIIAVALLTVIGLTFLASAHPRHGNYFTYIPQTAETIKKKDIDAFYRNVKVQAGRDAIDMAHRARLSSKSNNGFIADLQLASRDIIKRLQGE